VAERARRSTSIDDDINRDTWNSLAVQWFRGINSVLGCSAPASTAASNLAVGDDGVIGSSSTPGRRWIWRPGPGRAAKSLRCGALQRVVTASNPARWSGIEVDVNDVLAPDVGQWNLHP
jgi:hypothetical protein